MSDIERISCQFLKMQPIKSIDLRVVSEILQDSDYEISQSFQQELLNSTACHPTAIRYPPSSSYLKFFLKTVISKIEESGQEVQEDLYTTYTDLLSINGDSEYCFKTYCLGEDVSVTLKETKNMVVEGTTGMQTWEAGCFLTEWCLKNPQLFSRKRILELGAGLGLLGLGVIKKCNPDSYIFSDRHHGVLDTLARNLDINISEEETPVDLQRDWRDGSEWLFNNTVVKIIELDWEKRICSHDVDIILAADVVFSKILIPSLVGIIAAAIRNNETTEVYIASTRRNQETLEIFIEQLDLHGIDIRWTEEFHDYSSPHLITATIVLMRLSKKIDKIV